VQHVLRGRAQVFDDRIPMLGPDTRLLRISSSNPPCS
jgi:hypothetical protein